MRKPANSGRSSRPPLSLAGARIVVPAGAGETVSLAAAELARYLTLLTGKASAIGTRAPGGGPSVRLSTGGDQSDLGGQGYRIRTQGAGRSGRVHVAAGAPAGLLYGCYRLLEEVGMGFYAGGETFPELPSPAAVPDNLDLAERPVFDVRGDMLHYNFLCGCTDWGLGDYKFYFDQLARMRMNVLLMHWYDDEPGAASEVGGKYWAGGRTPNSLSKPWGAVAPLRTSEFSFETGRFFHEETFTSPAGDDFPDRITEIKQTEAVFREAAGYAAVRGVRVAAGFEAPPGAGDPTCPATVARFEERIRQFVARNPHLTYFALWQHESGGCTGTPPPEPATPAGRLHAGQRETFACLGNEPRIWEAIRFGRFAAIAADLLAREAPHLRMVVVGWGGDRWMRFADLCLAYDRLLPKSVIFTCHDNIDASMGPTVSGPWGRLPADRERWAMPWVEGDIEDCWVRQPNVESLGKLAPDALRKGCQGLLTMHWRTRDVEEETAYAARFAWDPRLTPNRFYRDVARRAFGPDQQERMGRVLARLQRLGSRWSGVRGTQECSRMLWTGWQPHFPFELDGEAAVYLARRAEEAAATLSAVPGETARPDEGAFHLRGKGSGEARRDPGRLGAAEMADAARRLHQLAAETSAPRLRRELRQIHEEVYDLRYRLVEYGMTSPGYRAIDGFLIPLHHLVRNAGARGHRAALRAIRRELVALRALYEKRHRTQRLERLDYLAATIDFVLSYDPVAMLLADGEEIERALEAAGAARGEGGGDEAAGIAARAYERLVQAGMPAALRAQTRKLTTRCDWGVLATLNVKPMPKYWETLARLESFLPAAPPRELRALGLAREVWVSWEPVPGAAGYHLFRRPAGRAKWTRVTAEALNAGQPMFIDRPRPGSHEYAACTLSAQGLASPLSHPQAAVCGAGAPRPCLAGAKPHSHLRAGEEMPVRAVVLSDRGVAEVSLVHRTGAGGPWRREPMRRRFRDSYASVIPAPAVAPGLVEFYVEAVDAEGRTAVWPESAPGLPWSLSVTAEAQPKRRR